MVRWFAGSDADGAAVAARVAGLNGTTRPVNQAVKHWAPLCAREGGMS